MKYRFVYLAMAAALAVASACTGDDTDDGQQQGEQDGGAGGGGEQDAGTGEDGEADAGEGDAGTAAPLFGTENCPNGEVQEDLGEECDDGDLNDRDGCTRLCEFTCKDDDDCDDLNICNGTETCTADHTCEPGDELEDGEFCGPDLSCWAGICAPNACGDGRAQGDDEQCDDGDADDSNGCTTACQWTCEENVDCEGGDECSGADTCDLDSHTCTGTALVDETPCTMVVSGQAGWCQSGVCVPTDCGDGDQEGAEECDLGDQNGVKGSGCSIDCKTQLCGNGTIEGDEQCDDGALEDWDGCDKTCRAELVHRMRELQILTTAAPDFCVYPEENRLGDAFPGAITVLGFGDPIDVVDFVNGAINSALNDGQMHPLVGVVDSSDTSIRTNDEEVELALISGDIADEEWIQDGPRLDYPYLVDAEDLEDGKATNSLKAEQTGGGKVVTTEPSDLIVSSPLGGSFEMRQLMVRTIFDPEKLSTPEAPPELADGVVLPEESGVGEADENGVYHPKGTMCGVQPLSALHAMPLFAAAQGICCDKDGANYVGCQEGQNPPDDCSSIGDVLLGGCKVCLANPLDPMAGFACAPGCAGLQVVEPIEPDADLDGDGVNDGFTTVMAFESIRIRVRDLTEE